MPSILIFDLPTVVALTALNAFFMGAGILLANRTQSNNDPSMGSLGGACLLQSLGWLLVGLRDQIPLGISALGSNVAFLASGLCYVQAVNVFVEGAPHGQKSAVGRSRTALLVICSLYCAAISWFWWFAPNIAGRILASALLQVVLNGLCAARLLSVSPLSKSRRIVGIGFGLIVVLQFARIVKLGISPPKTTDLAALFASQNSTLIFGHISVVMLTFLFVLMVHDRAARGLRELVTHDYLTGAFNRSAFDEFARQTIEQTRRSHQTLSLMLFDIDHFKDINDTLGHLTGDVALRSLTQISADNLRAQDVLGRYGGEEFAVLLPGTDAKGAFLVAERIRQSIADTELRDNGTAFSLTISIGIAQFPIAPAPKSSTEQQLTALFRAADVALYDAKRAGRNRTVISEEI